MQNIIVITVQRKWLERGSGHDSTGVFNIVGEPDTPCFQLYFRPPRMRSSRGLTSLPIPSSHS